MAKLIVVDVEGDGPCPGIYSMVCFGAIVVDRQLDKTFYGQVAPISRKYEPEALAVSGFTREQHEKFERPNIVMKNFADWLNSLGSGQKIFISDNPAFDWQFINYYFHAYYGKNPFGFSAQRIGDKFQGFFNDPWYKWKKHRITKHTHNPVDNTKKNAEALLYLIDQGYKLKL